MKFMANILKQKDMKIRFKRKDSNGVISYYTHVNKRAGILMRLFGNFENLRRFFHKHKGNREVRESMQEMVRNADEIYVGIKQEGKFYVAYDAKTEESLSELMNLITADNKEN